MRKDENQLVSIVVPVYNIEKYLTACIESIIKQTYQKWELILVNDGSSDNGGSICEYYASRYNNIKYIEQVNKGVSAARRAGVDAAVGNWIVQVDGDDRLLPTALDLMVKKSQEGEYDIVIGAFEDVFNNGIKKKRKQGVVGELNANDYSLAVAELKVYMSTQGRLYRSALLKDTPVLIDKRIKNNEDFLFNYFSLPLVKKVYITPEIVYSVNHREGSASRKKYLFDYWIMFLSYVRDSYKKFGISDDLYRRYKLIKTFSLIRSDKNYDIDLKNSVFDDVRHLKYTFQYSWQQNIALYLLRHPNSYVISLLKIHPRHLLRR